MKHKYEKLLMALLLAVLSVALYAVHFFVFKDSHHIFIYLLGDIAFLPIEIVFVSMIFHRIIADREKKTMSRKLNMLIGVFFSEMGNELLVMLVGSDKDIGGLKNQLVITPGWTRKNFETANKAVDAYRADVEDIDLEQLKALLGKNKDFMLKIIENPTLLEHELFSELMMALFHLQEELVSRREVCHLTESDLYHIKNDIARVYGMLIKDWLMYTQHLKDEYPFLFSFSLRTNPFDDDATVEIS